MVSQEWYLLSVLCASVTWPQGGTGGRGPQTAQEKGGTPYPKGRLLPRVVSSPWHRAVEDPLGSSVVPHLPLLHLIKAPCPESISADAFSLAPVACQPFVLLHSVWGFSSLRCHLLGRL